MCNLPCAGANFDGSPMEQRQQNSLHVFFLLTPLSVPNEVSVSECCVTFRSPRDDGLDRVVLNL